MNLFHALHHLAEYLQILLSVNHSLRSVLRYKPITFLSIPFVQELLKRLSRAILHLDHDVDGMELLLLIQKVVHGDLREALGFVPARVAIIICLIFS